MSACTIDSPIQINACAQLISKISVVYVPMWTYQSGDRRQVDRAAPMLVPVHIRSTRLECVEVF